MRVVASENCADRSHGQSSCFGDQRGCSSPVVVLPNQSHHGFRVGSNGVDADVGCFEDSSTVSPAAGLASDVLDRCGDGRCGSQDAEGVPTWHLTFVGEGVGGWRGQGSPELEVQGPRGVEVEVDGAAHVEGDSGSSRRVVPIAPRVGADEMATE